MEIESTAFLDDETGKIEVFSGYFSEVEVFSDTTIDEFYLEQKAIKLFGKEVLQPRLISYMGDPGISYTYSRKSWILGLGTL